MPVHHYAYILAVYLNSTIYFLAAIRSITSCVYDIVLILNTILNAKVAVRCKFAQFCKLQQVAVICCNLLQLVATCCNLLQIAIANKTAEKSKKNIRKKQKQQPKK